MEYNWISYKGDNLKAPEDVQGFDRLGVNTNLFINFLRNFYNRWEYPERHVPVKVAYKKDKANGAYLRVDFEDEWYHVKGPNTWY